MAIIGMQQNYGLFSWGTSNHKQTDTHPDYHTTVIL